jgi:NAD(P)H-hydrate epimerase
MKIVSIAEMRAIDRLTSEKYGVPSLTLMENAGTAVANFVIKNYPEAKRVGVICGKGNNGGDGFVAARKLREAGRDVQVVLLAEPGELRGDAAEMFRNLAFETKVARSTAEAVLQVGAMRTDVDLVLDAILGTGIRPPATGLQAEVIGWLTSHFVTPIVSVDIPSGASADMIDPQGGPIAHSDAIVTFTAPRPAHVFGGLTAGPTLIVPIGSPGEALQSELQLNLTTAADVAFVAAPRPRASNKGSFGHVLFVGGSLGKAGAAALAGMSALRAGAGLCTVATAKSVLSTVAGFHPELMTEPLDETEAGTISLRALEYGRFEELAKNKTVLAVGPGISRHPETTAFVQNVVAKYPQPMVLDADGLNAFEGCANKLDGRGRVLVITPHPGEMARLLGKTAADVQRDRLGVARTFASDHHVIVVLKGYRTLVAHPDGEVWVNPTGNPGMATGGTGDVLTGIVAGLLAQHPGQAFVAVVAAVYLHGLAGDLACEQKGEPSLVASDLVHTLPSAFQHIRNDAHKPSVLIPA